MPKELVILMGLQGAGKSTFAKTFFAATHVYVSKDKLRNNRRPARRQRQLIEETLSHGSSVVVDNTNAIAAERVELIELGQAWNAEILGYLFLADLEECLARNRKRVGKARVPDVALFATRKRFEPPSYAEGFDRLLRVRTLPQGRFAVDQWNGT
jgi:predicted kinase